MIGRRSVSQWWTRQSSLRVIVLTERPAFVYPPPGTPFILHPARSQIQPSCLPPAFVPLQLYLLTRALTASVTIGRVHQTR